MCPEGITDNLQTRGNTFQQERSQGSCSGVRTPPKFCIYFPLPPSTSFYLMLLSVSHLLLLSDQLPCAVKRLGGKTSSKKLNEPAYAKIYFFLCYHQVTRIGAKDVIRRSWKKRNCHAGELRAVAKLTRISALDPSAASLEQVAWCRVSERLQGVTTVDRSLRRGDVFAPKIAGDCLSLRLLKAAQNYSVCGFHGHSHPHST